MPKNLERIKEHQQRGTGHKSSSDTHHLNEDHLGIKKFHLKKRSNSVFAQNLLGVLQSKC